MVQSVEIGNISIQQAIQEAVFGTQTLQEMTLQRREVVGKPSGNVVRFSPLFLRMLPRCLSWRKVTGRIRLGGLGHYTKIFENVRRLIY